MCGGIETPKKRVGLLVILLVSAGVLVSTATLPENVSGSVLYVGGEGPGNYSAIKYAVKDADPGDTIYVYWGDYYEDVIISKPLTLVGQNRVNTVIRGFVRIEADYVNITKFTVVNLVSEEAGIELYYARNCRITNTHTVESPYGIRAVASTSNLITGNLVQSYGEGISLSDSWNNHITDNIVEYNAVGIHLLNSPGNYVVGNSVSNDYGSPIYIEYSNDVTISENNVTENEDGIHIGQSVNTVFIDNYIHNNAFGAYLYSCANTTIRGNRISGGAIGVHLANCSNATITDSVVASVNGSGIYIDSSSEITITDNSILESDIGIDLHLSTNVSVYHNNMINNTVQANDDLGLENSWDNGYPSGGNYWSDYAGPDLFSGPNQDQPGSDNIGDEPYVIDSNSTDRYPLVLTFGLTRPPEFLLVDLSGKGLENVTLTWSLSPDDGEGLGYVTGYELYRGTSYHPMGVGYQLIDSLPNGTSEYIDRYAGEGNPDNYLYRLCAVDIYNDTACTQNQAGKFTLLLSRDVNLLSIPLVQSNESVEYVLQTVQYDKVWHYDSSSQEWKWHMTSKGYRRGLWAVDHTMGLWVNVTGDCSLTVAGTVPAQTTIHLQRGWNLVSFPSFRTDYAVSDLMLEIGATRVEGIESMPPFPPHRLRVLGAAEVLLAGEAYWVEVDADVDWIVEVS